ncbi:MAG: hypothetical protein GEU82_18450 [Luteitalea sp.]|nr:hypothetical protein [Luteitalea sp.]
MPAKALGRSIDAETLHALVPSLILQPLVENAIVHGIAVRSGAGRIAIRTSCEEGTLRVSVGDTGPGFVGHPAAPRRKGIGLTNTRERLLHLYGVEHRIEIGRGAGGGGVVIVSIPFQEQPEAARS